uniref:right-handed parallel beta-helix repeat-containing protein n=1 Tax=Aeromonas sp. TaxID=647 RepID=UPI001A946CCD|nr:right-handed parallel beta-helix repeat-containing protein [Aeromonas sp.]QRX38483.1 Right-handed parallel beta-helix repeat-containing [Aeromonas sp.]
MKKLTTTLFLLMVSMHAQSSEQCSIIGVSDYHQSPHYTINSSLWVTANSYDELVQFIEQKKPYIYVPDDVTIVIPNKKGALTIGENQTVFSSRSVSSQGGLILVEKNLSDSIDDYPVIYMKSGARISGMRIEGPEKTSSTHKKTIGIQSVENAVNITVDNNEVYGWPWAGVSIKKTTNAVVKNNYIHDNIKSELGYGVVVQNGYATAHIQCNIFNKNRHAIAGSGKSGEGYYAINNLVMQGGGYDAYHQFDMHADGSEPMYGGSFFVSKNNWFDFGDIGTMNRSSIMLRGIPRNGVAIITGNKFKSDIQLTPTTETVTGVPGSIPSKEELKSSNDFNTNFSYFQQQERCFMTAGNEDHEIYCKSINL